jgi:hypothetical protein
MNLNAAIRVALTIGLLPSLAVSVETIRQAPFVTGSHLQLVRRFYTTADGLPADEIRAVAVTREGVVLAVGKDRVARLEGDRWLQQAELSGISSLFAPRVGPSALAGGTNGVWLLNDGNWQLDPGGPANVIAFSDEPSGIAWAMGPSGVWRRDKGWTLINKVEDDAMFQPYSLLPRSSNEVLIASETGLFGLAGKRLYWLPFEVHSEGLPSSHARAVARLDEDHFLVTTDKGLTLSNGSRGWQSFTGAEGLPILSLKQIAVSAERVVWLGSDEGLIEWNGGRWSYFESKRWLPSNKVTAIAAGTNESVWVGTPAGLAHLFHRKLSFAEKADILQRDLESRDRRHGYVTEMELRAPGKVEAALQEISDNDGDWTSLYVASQAFRYAVTKAPEAKTQGWRSMQALLRLESITGIPGFPARAICRTNEPAFVARAIGSDSEWHQSSIESDFYWKGETSSDEIDGHYLGWYVYYELAADEEQKKAIRATCKRVTDHILEHNYSLIDKDGKPTTWACWGPDRLNDDPRYWEERGVNSVEILSHLKVAMHIVQDARYDQAYRDLIKKHHYALNTLPAKIPHGVVFDNELLFMAYYPLLQLEKDPALRAFYVASLRRTWSFVRGEANPVWNFIVGASTGEPCDVEAAVETLREIPLDFIHWKMKNSHRADIDPAHRKPLPWSNRVIHHWDSDPFDLDGGGDMGEGDQTVWLFPYWMGRYHGFIQ